MTARGAPAPLLALMAASLLLAVTWAFVNPAFQAPDEPAHFAYVQYLGETFSLPGAPQKPIYSTEHAFAAGAVNSDQVTAQPFVKPEWSQAVFDAWRARRGDARDDGGGAHSAANYPPLAYLWEAGGYKVAGGSFFSRLAGARIASALWLPVTVLATWLLAGELLGRRRLSQTVAAALPALAPMVVFISASTGPDGMMYALWSLALWLGVKILRGGLSVGLGAALTTVAACACVAKATSYALLPAVGLVLVVGVWRARERRFVLAACSVAPLVAILGGWIALARALDRPAAAAQLTSAAQSTGLDVREFFSYLWQFYLPRLPGQDTFPFGRSHPAFDVWVKQTTAAFGWLEVRFPAWVYVVVLCAALLVLAGALVALWRAQVDRVVAAFLALAVLGLLAGLHWTDYHSLKAGAEFFQGRYLFPLIALAGVALAAAVEVVPGSWRERVAGAVPAALFVLHLAAFGLVLERFYA